MATRYMSVADFSVSDIILREHGYHACVSCYKDENLRELPCEHLLCSNCINTLIQTSQRSDVSFSCPQNDCQELCSGSSSSFPPAMAAEAANHKIEAQRQTGRGEGGLEAYANSEEAMKALDEDFHNLLTTHTGRIALIQDSVERQKALQDTNTVWGKIKQILNKVWEAIKAAASWVWEGIKTVGRCIKGLWNKLFG